MTGAPNDHDHALHAPRRPARRCSPPIDRTAATAALVALALLAVACGRSSGHGGGGASANVGNASPAARLLAYARCMRSRGVADFPDPTTPPGGGAAFSIDAGRASDLNPDSPTFKAANQACRALSPAGEQSPAVSAQKLAAEVTWANCIRSRGVPDFPDPNGQGAFDSAALDPTSPAFRTATTDCDSVQPTGSVSAVPGHP